VPTDPGIRLDDRHRARNIGKQRIEADQYQSVDAPDEKPFWRSDGDPLHVVSFNDLPLEKSLAPGAPISALVEPIREGEGMRDAAQRLDGRPDLAEAPDRAEQETEPHGNRKRCERTLTNRVLERANLLLDLAKGFAAGQADKIRHLLRQSGNVVPHRLQVALDVLNLDDTGHEKLPRLQHSATRAKARKFIPRVPQSAAVLAITGVIRCCRAMTRCASCSTVAGPSPGEGVVLLEKGVGCTLPESKQESGLSVGAVGPKEHPDEENSRSRADTRAASRLD